MPKSDYSSIRIVSGPDGMVVWDANRKAITGIFGADISMRPGRAPIMRINMICGHFDVQGTPIFAVAHPADGQPRPVARIEFCDGTMFEAPPLPAPPAPPPDGQVDPAKTHAVAAAGPSEAAPVQPVAPKSTNGAG